MAIGVGVCGEYRLTEKIHIGNIGCNLSRWSHKGIHMNTKYNFNYRNDIDEKKKSRLNESQLRGSALEILVYSP